MFSEEQIKVIEMYNEEVEAQSNSIKVLNDNFRKVNMKDLKLVHHIQVKPQLYVFDKPIMKRKESGEHQTPMKVRLLNSEKLVYSVTTFIENLELLVDDDIITVASITALDDNFISLQLKDPVKIAINNSQILLIKEQ